MTKVLATIALTKEREDIEWLDRLAKKSDGRPILQALSRRDGVLIASDGMRAHVVAAPDCMEDLSDTNERREANYRVCKPVVAWERENGNFPDIASIIPDGKPDAMLHVDPRFLIEALQGFEDQRAVSISLHSNVITIQSIESECERYAMLMAMYISKRDKDKVLWKPALEKRDNA